MIKLFYFDSLGSKVCYNIIFKKISRPKLNHNSIIPWYFLLFSLFLLPMQIRYPCSYINLHTTQLWFPRNQKWNFTFLAAYYRGFGIHPIFSRGLGIHTNKLYFPCRTNRLLALNSKNLNFHFATQSGMIIEKKTLLSQPWIKNSLWFLGNTSYSKNPHDIFLYHGDFLFFHF